MMFLFISFVLLVQNPNMAVQILNSEKLDSSVITNNIVYKVLQTCSKNDANKVAVLQTPNPTSPFIPFSWDFTNAIVIYDYDSEIKVQDMKTHPTNFQIIILYLYSSSVDFDKVFEYIPWSVFYKLIIVTFDSDGCSQCIMACSITFWHLQTDNIIEICKNKESQRVVAWSINLFANWAPKPWLRESDDNEKPIGISMRYMDENINTCDSIFYHKNLSCHHLFINDAFELIQAIVIKPYPPLMSFDNDGTVDENNESSTYLSNATVKMFNVPPDKWALFDGFDGKVLGTIFSFIQYTVKVIVYPDSSGLVGYLDWKQMREEVESKERINFNSRDLTYVSLNMTFIYPRVQREIRVVTQRRGVVAVPARIGDIFNFQIIISAAIISGLFILALKYLDGRDLGRAALDAFSLILGLSIPKLPNKLATRIFFGSLILYFIILSTHFQGNVTQIMTVPLAAANVDSLDDLDASGYTVYAGYSTYEDFESFRERFQNFKQHDAEHCIDLVLNDRNAACIDEAEYLYHEILKNKNLHLVNEPIRAFFSTYLVHNHWYLKERFERLYIRLHESGILHKWQKDIENLASIKAQIRESSAEYKSLMTLENFKIFFILLYAGLLICTVIWIAEILYSRENLIQSLKNGWNISTMRIYFYFRRVRQFFMFK